MKLRLGTRGSDLALTQARQIAAALEAHGAATEIVVISTSGDRSEAPSFGAIGPQGVFVREIEQALLDQAIDVAVHSCKDLPTTSPDGLVIGAIPPRVDPADWLLSRSVQKRGQSPFSEEKRALTPFLPPGARVGTSSARRQAWLRHLRPGVRVEPLRGNVPTRLKRLADGDYDAILLAGAGIARLTETSGVLDDTLAGLERVRLAPENFVPAPAQGAIAVQCRARDDALRALLGTIDDPLSHSAVDVERAALALAEGGCDTAFGAYARYTPDAFVVDVMLERDGRLLHAQVQGEPAPALAAEAMRALGPAERAAP